jgi:hypothetical protein
MRKGERYSLERTYILLQKIRFNKMETIVLLINLVYLGFSFYNDSAFFLFHNSFNSRAIELYIIIKVVWVISVVAAEYFLYLFYKKRLVCDREYLITFLVNNVIYLLIFVMIFPGNWGGVGDEFLVYWAAKNLWIWPQQGALPGMIMIWQLMFYPAVWMPILVQICISSLLFSRIAGKLWKKKRYITFSVFELTIFSCTSILFAYCPMRMWIFSVVFTALLAEIYFIYMDSLVQKSQMVYITILLPLAVCIRTEAKVMLITIPLVLAVVLIRCRYMQRFKKAFTKMMLTTVLLSVCAGVVFECFGGNAYKYNSLSAVSFICPLSVILTDTGADLENMEQELAHIDKVFPIKDITDNPSAVHFWDMKHWISDYENPSRKETRECIIASGRIIVKNLNIYLKSRLKMFAACIPQNSIHAYRTIDDTKALHENNNDLPADLYRDYKYNNPLRNSVVQFLSGDNCLPDIMCWIQYCFLIPILFLFLYTIYCLFRKAIVFIMILMTVWIQFILMFFLVPNAHCMYYLPFYLMGWMALGFLLEQIVRKVGELQKR